MRQYARPLAAIAAVAGAVIGGAMGFVFVEMVRTTDAAVAAVDVDAATLREGPGYEYAQVLVLTRESEVTVVGRNRAATWLAVTNPASTDGPPAWAVATDIKLGNTAVEALAVLPAPPVGDTTTTTTDGASTGATGSAPKPGPAPSTGATSTTTNRPGRELPACTTATDRPSPCVSRIEVVGEPALGQPFTLRITAANVGSDSAFGAISVSLPAGANAEFVPEDRSGVSIYRPPNAIARCAQFADGACRFSTVVSTPAQYVLAEKALTPWSKGGEQTFSIVVQPGAGQDTVNLLVRMALRGAGDDILNFPAGSDVLDSQQNFPAYLYSVRLAPLSEQEEAVRAEVEAAAAARAAANIDFYRDLEIAPIQRIATGEALAIYEAELARLQQAGAYIESRQILFAVESVELIDAGHAVLKAVETWQHVDRRTGTNEVTGSREARVRVTYTFVKEDAAWLIAGLGQEKLSVGPLPSPP